jgi:hypothetical protein
MDGQIRSLPAINWVYLLHSPYLTLILSLSIIAALPDKMLQKLVYFLALVAGNANAQTGMMLRFPCAQLSVERLDP